VKILIAACKIAKSSLFLKRFCKNAIQKRFSAS
jgi:hypothetical protein